MWCSQGVSTALGWGCSRARGAGGCRCRGPPGCASPALKGPPSICLWTMMKVSLLCCPALCCIRLACAICKVCYAVLWSDSAVWLLTPGSDHTSFCMLTMLPLCVKMMWLKGPMTTGLLNQSQVRNQCNTLAEQRLPVSLVQHFVCFSLQVIRLLHHNSLLAISTQRKLEVTPSTRMAGSAACFKVLG